MTLFSVKTDELQSSDWNKFKNKNKNKTTDYNLINIPDLQHQDNYMKQLLTIPSTQSMIQMNK